MRTSRPLKHAPRPLLESSNNNKSSKGKGKQQRKAPKNSTKNEGGDTVDSSVYSYAPEQRGKGVKQAARRLATARDDVRASNSDNRGKGKGKKREIEDDDEDLEDGENEDDIEDNTMDISKIRFKMGLDSDDEGNEDGDDDEDEEIDSDLAMTDGEEEPMSKQKKGKQQAKRKVAADFYSSDRQLDIDLDEDGTARREYSNSEDDDEEYMDLSEMLDRKDASTSHVTSKVKPVATTTTTTDDLKQFKPTLGGESDDEEDEDNLEEDEEEEDEDEDEDEDDEASDEESDEDLDSDDPEALLALSNLISSLPTKGSKRSLPGDGDDDDDTPEPLDEASKKRRRTLLRKERTEAVPEGEYVPARSGTTTGAGNGKLTLDSLLSSLSTAQAAALKKSLKPLQVATSSSNEDPSYAPISALEAEVTRLSADEAALLARERARRQASSSSSTGRSKSTGALPAPLAPLHQAKIERQAAQERLDAEVKKWEETVNRMKGISKDGADDPENRLVLPLLAQGKGKGTSGAELVAKFNPSNNLEKQIASLIASTGASQSSLLSTENSALMSALPPSSTSSAAHDSARVAQLRLARELMFRAERKAKRVAKIKSRTFRKIAKKSRSREALANGEDGQPLDMEEMAQLDALDGGDRAEVERERLETLRARERATLRHASGKSGATAGGRWSRSLRGMEGMDEDMKAAIKGRESKQELLRRKIMGTEEGAGSDDDDSDESGNGTEEDLDEETIKGNAFDELASLKTNADGKKELPKGLMGMKFMQKALQRQNDRVDGMIDDFKMQVEGDEDGGAVEEVVGRGGDLVSENPGRMVFAPSAAAQKANVPDTSQETKKSGNKNSSKTNGNVSVVAPPPPSSASTATLLHYNPFSKLTDVSGARPNSSSTTEEVNPWLTIEDDDDSSAVRLSRKTNEKTQGKDSKTAEKASARMKKEQNKSKDALKRAESEATVEIDLDKVLLANPRIGNGHTSPVPSSPATVATAAPPSSSQLPATSPAEVKRRKNREDAPPPSSAGPLKKGQIPSNGPSYAKDDDDSADSGSDNDSDALPESLKRQQGPSALKQRDLVARAFAGDNVVADFEEMKRLEIEADAPKEEDLTLPGWGSWSGKGVRKQKNARKIIKHIPGIEEKQRKDSKYRNVVISERKDKKAQKYLTKDLPYPYTSVKQYEQRLAQPTGVEWTTRGTHKEMTMPRVLTKPGSVIKPVTKQL